MSCVPCVSSWSVSPAAATRLLADAGLGVPQPFLPSHPYKTVAERDRLRASLVVDDALRQALTAFAAAPVAVVALGTMGGRPVAARACWGEVAVLATPDRGRWLIARYEPSSLVNALTALIPDTPAADAAPVTVASGSEDQSSVFGTRDERLVNRVLAAPVADSGMFVPLRAGEPRPPVLWRDTVVPTSTGTATARYVITSRADAGARWTTYTPGDRSRVAAAVRDAVDPLLREGTPYGHR